MALVMHQVTAMFTVKLNNISMRRDMTAITGMRYTAEEKKIVKFNSNVKNGEV